MADLASLIMQHAYNQPNLVQQFQQGRQQGMANQLSGLKLQQAQKQAGQQGRLAQMLPTATPEELVRAGFSAEGKALSDIQAAPADTDFLKEARKSARQTRDQIDKRAGEVQSAYNKADSLAEQARKGNRAARAGMIISTARLLSPGIVTDKDFQALTGGANPVQASMAFLADKNSDVAGMLSAYVDPLGEAFDADALLNIAGSTMASEANTILTQQADAMSRAVLSELPEKQIGAIFGGARNIDSLRNLLKTHQSPTVSEVAPQPPKTATGKPPMTNQKGWQLMTDASGRRAYVSPDLTEFEEIK